MADKNKIKITVEAENKTAGELAKARGEMDKTGATAQKVNRILAARTLLGVKPYAEIQRDIQRLQAAYNRLKRSGTTSAADLYQAKLRLQKKTAELRKETGDWAGELGKAKAGVAGLAAAGYLFVKSFQEYSQFSQRMGEVNTLIDVSHEKFASLGKEIRSLTEDIPQTASELAAAEYDIISAGVALEKSTGVLEKSAKAAVAGVTDTKTAANVGIAVINAYGKEIGELNNVYDILFQTVKQGVTTFPQLASSLGEVLPTAKAADVGIKAVSASIAALTKAGIRTPQATTALKGAINALAAPAPEAKKKFDELNITWKGLIPTLDEIRKKGLSIDQMRLLIPDVEARTGVLALTQNFDKLVDIMGEMENAGGATQEAYDKMADTPENQMKLFWNTIDDMTISAGKMVAIGLLPAAKAIRWLVEGFKEADPVTKILVGTITAAGVATAIWNLGLKHAFSGLVGLAVQAHVAQAAVGGLAAQFKALNAVTAASVIGLAIWAGYQVKEAVKAALEWKKAAEVQEKAHQNLIKNSDDLMRKYGEFKGVKLPDDITDLAQEDLEELRKKLAKARAYYTALKAKLEEQGDSKTLEKVNARLKEIQEDFKKVSESASDAAEEIQKPAEAVKATKEQLDEFEKQAKKSYEEATKKAADYAETVIEFEEKIKYARLSSEDKIRELGRKGLDEAEVWADKRREAEEKLYAAKQALAEKDYKLAEQLARDAEGLYADLATEVKGSKDGNDVVVQSLQDTKQVAINGVQAVGDFVNQLYTAQKDAAQKAHDEWQATADGIKAQLDEIAKQREAKVNITLKGLEEAKAALKNWVEAPAKKYVDIYERYHKQEAHRLGGIAGSLLGTTASVIKAATGRLLPGYGGGDKIRAILEAGEGVLNKEAVRAGGKELFYAHNNRDWVGMLSALLKKKLVNISLPEVSSPRMAFAGGGIAPGLRGSNETFTLRLQAGNVDMPLTVQGNRSTTRGMVKGLEKELIRMGLSRK